MTTTATTATRTITTRKIDADGYLARREVILDGKVVGEIHHSTGWGAYGNAARWFCPDRPRMILCDKMGEAILQALIGHLDRAEFEAAAAQFKVRLLG